MDFGYDSSSFVISMAWFGSLTGIGCRHTLLVIWVKWVVCRIQENCNLTAPQIVCGTDNISVGISVFDSNTNLMLYLSVTCLRKVAHITASAGRGVKMDQFLQFVMVSSLLPHNCQLIHFWGTLACCFWSCCPACISLVASVPRLLHFVSFVLVFLASSLSLLSFPVSSLSCLASLLVFTYICLVIQCHTIYLFCVLS